MSFGVSVNVTCRCSRCHRERDIELSRSERGGRVLPMATQDSKGSTYVAETREACECGANRIVIRMRVG